MTILRSEVAEDDELASNPLEMIEHLARLRDWGCTRKDDDELEVEVTGSWCRYQVMVTWNPELWILHFTTALDLKVPARKRDQIRQLLALANEKLWLGHFDLWSEEDLPVFRHGMLVRESSLPSLEIVEDIIDISVGECERFYPAFQFVVWGGKKPAEAMLASLLETEGEA